MLERLKHLPRDARDTLFLLLVIAWVIAPQVGNLPLWCSALALGVLSWRAWLAWTARALPSRWWVLLLLVLTIGATLLSHRTLLGRDAGVTLIVVLLSLNPYILYPLLFLLPNLQSTNNHYLCPLHLK